MAHCSVLFDKSKLIKKVAASSTPGKTCAQEQNKYLQWLWPKNWNRKKPPKSAAILLRLRKAAFAWESRTHTFQHHQRKTQIPSPIRTPWENGKDNPQNFWKRADVPKSVAPNPSIAGVCSWQAPPAAPKVSSTALPKVLLCNALQELQYKDMMHLPYLCKSFENKTLFVILPGLVELF